MQKDDRSKTAWITKKGQHISPPSDASTPNITPKSELSLNVVPNGSISQNSEKSSDLQKDSRAAKKSTSVPNNSDTEFSNAEVYRETKEDTSLEEGEVKYSIGTQSNSKKRTVRSNITLKDINYIQTLEKKNISELSSAEIQSVSKFAGRLWNLLEFDSKGRKVGNGIKSPFFRTWFGDWRAYDTGLAMATPIAPQAKVDKKNRYVRNQDTSWKIQITRDVFEDTWHYGGKEKIYLDRLMTDIDTVLQRAILLDSAISAKNKTNKKGSTQFMHYLYSVVEYNEAPFLAKITVEEYDVDGKRRAYNVERIKMSALSRAQYSQMKSAYRGGYASSADGISIADLHKLVKQFDKKISPKPVNPVLLNEDGTPKKFYHGTDVAFTEFKQEETSDREGFYFFAENREDAKAYGPIVMEVYLSAENLADYDNQPSEFYKLKTKREQVAWLRERRYDGWYSDMDSNGYGEVSVFDATQIKSATDNIGTFDRNRADIRYSVSLEDNDNPKSQRYIVRKSSDQPSEPSEGKSKSDVQEQKKVDDIVDSFHIVKLEDPIHVQKQVFQTLVDEEFFDENRIRLVKHQKSGMTVEINKSGIDEAFSYKNFGKYGKQIKKLKLATMRIIPEIIETGDMIADNIQNYHSQKSDVKYAYIEKSIYIDDAPVTVQVAIRKSPKKNKFWMHKITIENSNSYGPVRSRGQSKTGYHATVAVDGILSQNSSNVKGDNKKSSRKITDPSSEPSEGKSKSDLSKPLANYTTKMYNDFGWVRENDIISSGYWKDFCSKFADLKSGRAKFFKTPEGEYIIPVNDLTVEGFGIDNVLVYAKGTIESPKVSKIVKIDSDDGTMISMIMEVFYESKGILGEDYGNRVFTTYYEKDFRRRSTGRGDHGSGSGAVGQHDLRGGVSERAGTDRRGAFGAGYASTEAFRRIQAESAALPADITKMYHSGDRSLDAEIRSRFSGAFELELYSARSKRNYSERTLLNPITRSSTRILEGIDGQTYHDIFEIARKHLQYGELVDLHPVRTTDDVIGYEDCVNYLTDDGLSGFSITLDGDLISVFNLSDKRGFLKTIAPIVLKNAKTLDCFVSEKQNLLKMYANTFGFKTASLMI